MLVESHGILGGAGLLIERALQRLLGTHAIKGPTQAFGDNGITAPLPIHQLLGVVDDETCCLEVALDDPRLGQMVGGIDCLAGRRRAFKRSLQPFDRLLDLAVGQQHARHPQASTLRTPGAWIDPLRLRIGRHRVLSAQLTALHVRSRK